MSNKNPPTLVWLRRDLRVADNPALHWASTQQKPLILFYIDDSDCIGDVATGAAARWWLHFSLVEFQATLKPLGTSLRLFRGKSEQVIDRLLQQTGADTIVWNRRYEPWAIALDSHLKAKYHAAGLSVKSLPGNVLHEPWTVTRAEQQPYRVFTAYWRKSHQHEPVALSDSPQQLLHHRKKLPGEITLKNLELLPTRDWANGFTDYWHPGEHGAHLALQQLLETALCNYQVDRDIPSVAGTSRLSPHLAFGEISPRQIRAAVQQFAALNNHISEDNTECYLREIGWRDFACHLIFHFPHTVDKPLDARFEKIEWRKPGRAALQRWQRGNTGIPIVDAGMRELWQTGWMHNRIRMVVASLLIKNMGVHWLQGANWFCDTLVDADLASNTMGWQWVAGSGADAAPYFRIFNPVRQGERFDPDGIYVRKWVPEISELPKKFIHCPWTAPDDILKSAGVVLGKNYPRPIVDLSKTRLAALQRFDKIKTTARTR